MRKQPTSRMCFVCGRHNPVGLKLRFYEDREANQVRVNLTVPDEYQGYPGIVHGGIISAILDEVSARAALMQGGDDRLLATLRITTRFRRPTPTGSPLTAMGWVERIGGVGAEVAGEIRLADGTLTADCTGLLVEPPDEIKETWEQEKRYWKVDEDGPRIDLCETKRP